MSLGDGQGSRKGYLDAACGHTELSSELIAKGRVWLCIDTKDGFEDFELGGGCPSPVLDLIGGVGVESPEVDGGGVVGGKVVEGIVGVVFIAHGDRLWERERKEGLSMWKHAKIVRMVENPTATAVASPQQIEPPVRISRTCHLRLGTLTPLSPLMHPH